MPTNYDDPVWLRAMAKIITRQSGRSRLESGAELTGMIARDFERRARTVGR